MSGLTTNLLMPTPSAPDSGKDIIMSDALGFVDAALGTTAVIATTGGTTVLSVAQVASAVIEVTGALTSNATLEFPLRGRLLLVVNSTTGGFTLNLKSGPLGTPIALAAGAKKFLWVKNATGAVDLV